MFQLHIFAHGRVQGVNFRYNVSRRATHLGLKGYVRNLPDARVEILAQGEREDLEKLAHYIRSSPGLSYVVKVDADWEEDPPLKFKDFHVRF